MFTDNIFKSSLTLYDVYCGALKQVVMVGMLCDVLTDSPHSVHGFSVFVALGSRLGMLYKIQLFRKKYWGLTQAMLASVYKAFPFMYNMINVVLSLNNPM